MTPYKPTHLAKEDEKEEEEKKKEEEERKKLNEKRISKHING